MSSVYTNESFNLNGSFIVAFPTNRATSRVPLTSQPIALDESSPVCDFIRNHFPRDLTVPRLLEEIERDHEEVDPQLYLTNREVVLIPGEMPTKPVERVQRVRDLLKHLFTPAQIETSAQGHPKIAISTITPWQKFVLTSILNHFHRLLLNEKYYNNEIDTSANINSPLNTSKNNTNNNNAININNANADNNGNKNTMNNVIKKNTMVKSRDLFIEKVFSFFIPVSLKAVPVRIAAPVDLIKGNLPSISVSNPKDLACLIVTSPTDITVLSPNTMTWPTLEFNDRSYVDNDVIHLKKTDSSDDVEDEKNYVDFICRSGVISDTTWRQILWPSSAPHRNSIQSVIESCKSFGVDPFNVNAAAATGIARVVSSIDNSFALAFYATFTEDSKVFEVVLKSMLQLFISEHREMQLLKLVSYFELNRTIDLNEMFRKNNNYFRTITFYINLISDNYKQTTIKDLYKTVAAAEQWSFDHPNEKDIETVDVLISKFFTILTEQIDKVPQNVRSLCRFLRLLCEKKYREPSLIFRPIFAVFLLRYIFPALCAPMDLGVGIKQKELAKVIQFTKLLAYSGQNQHLTGEHQGDRKAMNEVIDKNAPLVTKFYETLCTEGKGESAHITKPELIESAIIFRDYVVKNEKVLAEFKPPQLFENIFVDELLAEFVSSTLQ